MKLVPIAIAATLAGMSVLVIAQSGDMKGLDMKSAPTDRKAAPAAYKSVGVVRKTDPAKGTVTLAHEAIKELKWPAMTMPFLVKDKTLYEKLVVDRTVEFEFVEQAPSQFVITRIALAAKKIDGKIPAEGSDKCCTK